MLQKTGKPRIKICCIASVEEAQLAIQYGASALGLVSKMPSGPGVISEDAIAEIAATIPPGVSSFLLTSKQDVSAIIAQQQKCRVNTIQICDRLKVGTLKDLREAMPGVAIVQVIHVTGQESVEEAVALAKLAGGIAPQVNALLLDSGNPNLSVKELGGTGRLHNWSISKIIRESVDVPIFLAGGLKPENVRQAIATVRPFGLDLCTGVRKDGKLDEAKLAQFFHAVQ